MNAGTLRKIMEPYKKDGFSLVDDFLPEKAAEELNNLYRQTQWEEIEQVRPDHYKHVFSTSNSYFPRPDETYMAKFGKSRALETSTRIKEIFDEYFVPLLKKVTKKNLTQFDIRCYRLKEGQFYRTHIDDYAGDIGLIYYINKRWVWDWGGILHVGDHLHPDFIQAIFPKFNRLVLLNHKEFRSPHFITPVTSYAAENRHTLIAFNREPHQ